MCGLTVAGIRNTGDRSCDEIDRGEIGTKSCEKLNNGDILIFDET